MRTHDRTRHGFSLLEVMIALAVMGVVTTQLFIVMGNQKKVYASNERAVDAQETARMTLDLISFDTRMAGYLIPTWTAVSSIDGGDTDPDRYCASMMFVDPGVTGSGNPMEVLNTRFAGAEVTGLGGTSITIASQDIDGDGANDFTVGTGIIIASETETYCGRITFIAPAAPPSTAATITLEDDSSPYITNLAARHLRAVPANIYELDKDKLELSRNGMLLASQIEDFQVEFWVDGGGLSPGNGIDDGGSEFPVNKLNNPDPPAGGLTAHNDLVRRVRVSVLAVTPMEDQANSATGHLSFGRPQVANRKPSATVDRLRRRMFSVSVMPRNVVGVKDPSIL